jgi:hypothetical protein
LGSQKKGCQVVSMMQRKWQTTLPMTTPPNKSIVLHKIQNSSFTFVQSYNVKTTATKMQSFTSFMISHKLQNAVACKSCILRHFSRCKTKPMAYEQKQCQLNFQRHYTILEQYGTIIMKAHAGLTWVQSPGYLDLGNWCLMTHCSEWEASLLNDLMSREQQFLCLKHSD